MRFIIVLVTSWWISGSIEATCYGVPVVYRTRLSDYLGQGQASDRFGFFGHGPNFPIAKHECSSGSFRSHISSSNNSKLSDSETGDLSSGHVET